MFGQKPAFCRRDGKASHRSISVISFYVIQGNDQGRRFDLNETTTGIGRDPGNRIHLKDAEVSRKHAKIVYSEGEYEILDGESVNGVFVNGRRVKQHALKNGDQVLLGQTLLLFANRPPTEKDFRATDPDTLSIPAGALNDENHEIVRAISSITGQAIHSPMSTDFKGWSDEAEAHLKMMYHTTLVTSQTLDIGVLLHRILDLIFQWLRIDRGSIMLFDQESHLLIPQATRLSRDAKDGKSSSSTRLAINKSIVGYVLKRREGVLTNDAQTDPRWAVREQGIREVICVPMQGRYGLVGIIYIDTLRPLPAEPTDSESPSEQPWLTADHLRLMIAIAHQAALAVEDTRYYKGMIRGERLAAVGQTVTTLSHHIKNILQGISGGSHLIQMGLNGHDEDMIRRGWGIVEKNQTRISRLILDMLTFSREREPSYEFGDIRETIRDVVELMQPRAEEMNVRIVLKNDAFIPKFYFDAEQIHRAITNIVTNGIDAAGSYEETEPPDEDSVDFSMKTHYSIPVITRIGSRRGEIQVESAYDRERGAVSIVVDDNGPGVPILRRAALFNPFYSEKKGRGTGLGLSVANKVVEEHGGTIRIDDSPLDGARFVIELPCKLVLDEPMV